MIIFRWNTKKVGDGPHMDSTYMLLPDFANDSIYLMDPETDEFPPCGMTVTLRIDPQMLDDHSCIDIIMSESYYESDGHYWPAGKTLMEILYVGIYKVEGGFLLKNGWRIDSRQEEPYSPF